MMNDSRGKPDKLNAMMRAVNCWIEYGLTAKRARLELDLVSISRTRFEDDLL
jgi:hypothetical protein